MLCSKRPENQRANGIRLLRRERITGPAEFSGPVLPMSGWDYRLFVRVGSKT